MRLRAVTLSARPAPPGTGRFARSAPWSAGPWATVAARAGTSRAVRSVLGAALWTACLVGPVAAQAPGSPYLLPPALPGAPGQGAGLPLTLPGGAPLPGLSAGAQNEILQRILDAANNRAGTVLAAPPAASPGGYAGPGAPPQPFPAGPVGPAEELSNTERFFAARLPEQAPPLRQFGYDTFRGYWVPNS